MYRQEGEVNQLDMTLREKQLGESNKQHFQGGYYWVWSMHSLKWLAIGHDGLVCPGEQPGLGHNPDWYIVEHLVQVHGGIG